jgi:hypothetical protein
MKCIKNMNWVQSVPSWWANICHQELTSLCYHRQTDHLKVGEKKNLLQIHV